MQIEQFGTRGQVSVGETQRRQDAGLSISLDVSGSDAVLGDDAVRRRGFRPSYLDTVLRTIQYGE